MKLYEIIIDMFLLESQNLKGKYLPKFKQLIDTDKLQPDMINQISYMNEESDELKIYSYLSSLDQTPGQKYVKWIFELWLRGNLRVEDGREVTNLLATYIQKKDRIKQLKQAVTELQRNDRDYDDQEEQLEQLQSTFNDDINQIKTLPNLYEIVKDLDEVEEFKSGKQLKKEMKKDVITVYEDPNEKYDIFVPMTKAASCHLGKNTRWCTAWTDTTNYFENYHKDGFLYVIYSYEGDKTVKYQIHPARLEWKDAANEQITDIKSWVKKFPGLLTIEKFKQQAKLSGALEFFDINEITTEMFLIAVASRMKKPGGKEFLTSLLKQKNFLEGMPQEQIEQIMSSHGGANFVEFLPPENRTYNIYFSAVSNDGRELINVPEDIMDDHLVRAAIRQDVRALAYAPDQFKTVEAYYEAINKQIGLIDIVPANLLDDVLNLYSEEGKIEFRDFKEILPRIDKVNDQLAKRLISRALKINRDEQQNSKNLFLDLIPEKFINYNIISKAVRSNYKELEIVTDKWGHFAREDLYVNKALSANPDAIEFFPDKYMSDKAISKSLLGSNALSIYYIDSKFITTEILINIVKKLMQTDPERAKLFVNSIPTLVKSPELESEIKKLMVT